MLKSVSYFYYITYKRSLNIDLSYVIIMISLKWIFITTSISILLSAYSIYNLIDYLCQIEIERIDKINQLIKCIQDVNTQLNETIK